MNRTLTGLSLVAFSLACAHSLAADYRVEVLKEGPPKDAVSEEVAAQLADTGLTVIRGTSRTVCDIWLCKEWPLKSLQPGQDVIYPFEPGQLIGVARYPRKGSDFRDQEIAKGVYTLRYAQQPVDGSHVGTSPTRDFLLLLQAEKDRSMKIMEYEALTEASAEAIGTTHPGMLSMQRMVGEASAPSMRNHAEFDWWIARMQSTAKAGSESKPLTFDLVVVGAAPE